MARRYHAQLRDPRWQKRRLQVFARDGWTCQQCGARDRELQVHHLRYQGQPWEAPDAALQTLCVDCHRTVSGPGRRPRPSEATRDTPEAEYQLIRLVVLVPDLHALTLTALHPRCFTNPLLAQIWWALVACRPPAPLTELFCHVGRDDLPAITRILGRVVDESHRIPATAAEQIDVLQQCIRRIQQDAMK